VAIAIDWPDARMAYQLVDTAQRNFLEARHIAEVSSISEAISILEGRASSLREEIEADVTEVEEARKDLERRRPKPVIKVTPPPVSPSVSSAKRRQDEDLAQLRMMLESKNRAIADLEELRRRQLGELQAKLTEAKATYSDAHPVVIEIQQRIDSLESQEDSVQLSTLREEKKALEKEAIRRGALRPDEVTESPGGRLSHRLQVEPSQLARATTAELEEAPIEQAKGNLRYALAKYHSVLDRIDAAQMEMDSARAAFKYRYSILMPAEVPRNPVKPNVPFLLLASAIGGIVLAILLAGVLDLRSGLVLERWQIERQLDLPVLGELRPG
jgi:hypothetical protein